MTLAVLTYGLYRVLRPELYPGDSLLGGVVSDLGRVFLHLDFGESCGNPGCPSIQTMWARSWTADLYLLVGGIVVGVLGGLAAAAWCAARPRTLSARAVEAVGSVVYSMPVYVVAFGNLLRFEPTVGVLPLPLYFHPLDYETPLASPWDFVRSMAVPWLVVGAPLGAITLRLALVSIQEVAGTDHVRTAIAKGLSRRRVIRHHAAPSAYVSVASLVAAWVPTFVTNMVLVEFVLFVPGFFVNTRRAIATEDIAMLQALTIWAAVIVVVISTLADLALVLIDPRIRRSSGLPG
ncbi:MAG: ABC transporter permease subunit [Solirubrobacteraceae bacterium]